MSAPSCHDTSLLSDAESFESGEVLPHCDVLMSDSGENLWIMITPSDYILLQNHRPTEDSSDLLISSSYDTACHSFDYLASLTRCPASDNDINPTLLVRYSNQDTNNSCDMSESDWSDMLANQSEPESNIQPNTGNDNLFCENSAGTTQNQLLADYLVNDVSDILDHDTASASSGADKQHGSGEEQTNTYKRLINMKQADKLSAQYQMTHILTVDS
ncbi:hypothetical protein LOZ61_005563 [Ophidiomyces ophidiicola]|nr:hypothetical protein LOZ61_005563 [Ophidiomyces ophidiicola]KAI1924258.1 hypothetical protein LOZ60_004806 [Ophidiomyces ophidiicola]KAI1953351.1 hypothetical protein LOZ59_005136 [Ophidiomyces ophidiicola]KAI2020026.1 hypothetical protein LOZ45_005280 [Ophidiomyces ophidiicola]KAI2034868.1 hypothetical protein LOZ48_001519 [Ophidiomyces ophidiicola]